MKTKGLRYGIRLTALLLFAAMCVLACAGCFEVETTEPTVDTTAETTAEATNPTPTEPAIDAGAPSPVRTADGSKVALNPTGLSFTGIVDKDYYEALTTAYGEENVKIGFVVVPTESVSANAIDPVAENAVKIRASAVAAEGNEYRASAVFTISEEDNYPVNYSALAFVEVYGTVLRYAEYSAAAKGNLLEATRAAMNDLANERSAVYKYAVTIGSATKYSPFTQRQYDMLSQIRSSVTFSVMSYNIEVYASSGGWEGRNPAKALSTVREQSPDIVGFQEVNAEWNSMLSNLAESGGYTRLKGSPTTDNFEKNEIFFKTDKFTLITDGTKIYKATATELNIENTESANESLDKHGRAFHYAVLEQKSTGRKILVVNTHQHYGGTGTGHEEDDKVRRYEIRTLLAWLEAQAATYPDQIVMGDMNSHYKGTAQGSVNMALFTTAGYLRTSDTAEIQGDVGGTLAINNRTVRERYIFDYVLVKGQLGTAHYTVVDNPVDNGNYPSDHIPVMAKLYFQ